MYYANNTIKGETITENGNNALITIPSSGYYDETSKISVSITTIKNEIDSLNGTLSVIGSSGRCYNVSADGKTVTFYVNGYECSSYSWTVTIK